MTRFIRMPMAAAAAVLFLAGAPRPALASVAGYVCNVQRVWADVPQLGQHGCVTVLVSTGPHCTGTQYTAKAFRSTGANTCTSHLLNETQIESLFQSLTIAASQALPIAVYTDAAGDAGCPTALAISGN